MNAPTTAIQDFLNVRVSWQAAYANSDYITEYQIYFLASTGDYVEDTEFCGSAQTILTALTNDYCDIPLADLREGPFSLA
jgi:hypothetical protein